MPVLTRSNERRFFLATFLALHTALLAWTAWRNSPMIDEGAHLVAGISIWQFGRYDLYSVNPPLVRMVASAPVATLNPQVDWERYEEFVGYPQAGARPEFSMADEFLKLNLDRAGLYFSLARWVCIPFSLIGAYFCWCWGSELYGPLSGALALVLWCFSPNVLAWGATIMPDLPAASLGLMAGYFFWSWLRAPGRKNTLLAGLGLGIALLVKTTWIILFAVWPLLCLVWIFKHHCGESRASVLRRTGQMPAIIVLALLVLNLGYSFEGTFTPLGAFTFVSRTLTLGESLPDDDGQGGNRFAQNPLAKMPVPFPKNYVIGIDLQKLDFEERRPSYLFGTWKERGWWYYYLVCALLKIPLGTWGLALLVLALGVYRRYQCRADGDLQSTGQARVPNRRPGSCDWGDELVLLLPPAALFCLVSSQTGFSCHFRYVLPGLPFVLVWVSRVALLASQKRRFLGFCALGLLSWSVASSLSVYPYCISYFNELAGGPNNGHKYLLGSSVDWGQDVLRFRRWHRRHPEVEGLSLRLPTTFAHALVHRESCLRVPGGPVDDTQPLEDSSDEKAQNDPRILGPRPGWFAGGIHSIYHPHNRCRYLLEFQPRTKIGYSIYTYHLTFDQANRVREWLKLPRIEEPVTSPGDFTRQLLEKVDRQDSLRVAVFHRNQRAGEATKDFERILDEEPSMSFRAITPQEIRDGALAPFDVVLFPGGSGREQSAALEAEGRAAVRQFVEQGGGYVGVCGGAFLGAVRYNHGLEMINVRPLSGVRNVSGKGMVSVFSRGAGPVSLEFTESGQRIFGGRRSVSGVRYSGGPVFIPANRPDSPEPLTLARFSSEICKYDFQEGTMVDTPAIVAAPYGRGKVILISPHPEASLDLQSIITTAVKAVAD